jgi:SNF family Na+-dependent transporter
MEFKLVSVAGGKKAVDELRRALAKEDIRIPSDAVKRTPTSDAQKTRTDLTFTVALSQTNAVNQALVSSKASLGYQKLEMKTETTTFFDLMDKYFGTLCLIIISLSLSIYIGWMWDSDKIIGEIEHGYPGFTKPIIAGITPAALWIFCIRFICPVVIFVVLLGQFGVEIF